MGRYGDDPPPTNGGAQSTASTAPARRSRPRPLTISTEAPGVRGAETEETAPSASAFSGDGVCLASPAPWNVGGAGAGGAGALPPSARPPASLFRGPSVTLPSPVPAATPSLAGLHRSMW